MDLRERNARRIRALLLEKGLKLTEVADRAGVPRIRVNAALREPMAEGESAIASALGLPPAELWPERYDARGHRLHRQPIANYRGRAVASSRNAQRRRA